MIRPVRDQLRLMVAVVAALLGFASFAAGQTSYLNGGLVDVEVAGDSLLAISTDGELLRSTNDGASFVVTYTPDAFEKPLALAASGSTAIAVCESGVVLRSTNSGASWSEANAPLEFATFTSVASNGSGTWLAVGQTAGQAYVIRSTDNGANWSSVNFAQTGSLETVDYDASASVWMIGGWRLESGRTGIAFRSTDNGSTWSVVTLPAGTGSVSALAANGSGTFGLVGADGFYAAVSANGTVLASESGSVSESLTAIEFSAAGNWIVGGMESLVIRFSNAGEGISTEVVQESTAGAPEVAAIAENAAGTLFVASEVGFEASVPDPKISISLTGGELVVTATGLGLGREYSLYESTDLVTFEIVPGTSVVSTSGTIRWIVSQELEETTPVFWKLAEN